MKEYKNDKKIYFSLNIAMWALCFNDEMKYNIHYQERRQSLYCLKNI